MKIQFSWKWITLAFLALSMSGCLLDSGHDNVNVPELFVTLNTPNATEIDTTDRRIDISGTVSALAPVESVTWTNSLGGSGTANGAENWRVDNIPLKLGNNRITVTATTVDGKSAGTDLVVNRESQGTGSATMSWIPPTQRADGQPLTNLAGYRIYYGRMSEAYDYQAEVANAGLSTYVVEGLVPGDWYFVAVAYDSSGKESDYSNEVTRRIL